MMTTLICKVCSEPKVVTSRSVVLPFVCDECQKAEELYNAMAPTPAPLKVEESDNHACDSACDSATIENTTLLIEDQANQLALAKNEVEGLWAMVQLLDAREIALATQVTNRQNQLAVEVGKLAKERDAWMKRALFARRQYDRVVADRAYYRGKLKDAGIKA